MTQEERDERYFNSIFECCYRVAGSDGGDGSSLVICTNRYNNERFTYTYLADRFEKFLIDKHDYVKIDDAHKRDENNKRINPYLEIEKGKHPFSRHEGEHDGNKYITFQGTDETGYVFQDGATKVPRKSEEWYTIRIIL